MSLRSNQISPLRRFARAATSLATAFALAASPACGGEVTETAADDSEVLTPRSAPSPGQIEGEVMELRVTPISLSEPSPVGALPASSSVDAAGGGHYTIPIDVTPGPRGMQPELAVVYGSNDGDGALGHRFDLTGVSAIARCPKSFSQDGRYAPILFDDTDPLCLNGERIVLNTGVHGKAGAEYRPQRNPFDRVVLDDDIDVMGGTMTVHTRDRRILTFGTVPASMWNGTSFETMVPWRWNIVRQCDLWSNCIDYEYDHGDETATGPTELRLAEIRYGGTGSAASQRKVTLAWDDRSDATVGWLFGQELRRTKVVTSITVTGPLNAVVRRYQFEYQTHAQSGRTQLASATMCNAAGTVCLPPTIFEWPEPNASSFNLEGYEYVSVNTFAFGAEQAELLESKQTLLGDFDGNGDDEFLFRGRDADAEWVMWFGDDDEDDDDQITLPDLDGMMPPGNEWVEAYLATADYDSPFEAVLQDNLHRFQPEFAPAVVDFDGDASDDLLVPVRHGFPGDNDGFDSDQHPVAGGFALFINTGNGAFGIEVPDDGSDENIYQMIPTDHEGDGFTDVWMCRGEHYNDAQWVLAHHRGELPVLQYEFLATGVPCSAHDEITFASIDGGPTAMLVVPAYEEPGGDMVAYDERGAYQVLRFDVETGAAALEPSGLPRDTYQRTHDVLCRNGYSMVEYGGTVFSAGIGHDKHIDLNDDGLVDILRFEILGGDGAANIPAIADGLGYGEWESESACRSDDSLEYDGGIVPYYNTGAGFIRGDFALEMDGNAHANFWLNFVGSVMTDVNDDDRPELILPGYGPGTGWTAFGTLGDGSFAQEAVDAPPGWPSYTDDDEWRDNLERFLRVRILAVNNEIGGRPDLAFIGVVEGDDWPHAVNIYTSPSVDSNGRMETALNGLGAETEFYYEAVFAAEPASSWGRAALVRQPLWVTTRHNEVFPGGGRTRHYEYRDATRDRHGEGFLGFGRVLETEGGDRTLTTYDVKYNTGAHSYATRGLPSVRERYTDVSEYKGGGEEVDAVHVERQTWHWRTRVDQLAGGATYFSYPETVEETGYRFAPGECEPGGCAKYRDNNAYRKKVTTEARDQYATLTASSEVVMRGPEEELTTTTLTQSQIVHDKEDWILGKVGRVDVESCDRFAQCEVRSTVSYFDDDNGAVLSITVQPDDDDLELDTTYTYDDHGNIEDVSQSDGVETRTTTTTWDPEGVFAWTVTDAMGNVAYAVNDPASGVPIAVVDAAGLTERTTYDGFYRVVGTSLHSSPTGPDDGAPTSITYAAGPEETPLVVETTTVNGQRTTELFGRFGELREKRWLGMSVIGALPVNPAPAGAEVYERYDYDLPASINTARSVPQWLGAEPEGWYERTVDDLGRTTSTTAPDGTVLERRLYSHDGSGDETFVRTYRTNDEGLEVFSAVVVAADGTVRREIDEHDIVTCFEYGPFGDLTNTLRNCQDAGGTSESQAEYDSLGHPTLQHDAFLGARESTWNAFGELVHHADGAGRETSYFYDSVGRLQARIDDDGETEFTWDTERVGALDASLSPDGVEHLYDVDDFGRIVRDETVIPSASGDDAYVFESHYGPGGRLERLSYPTPDLEPAFTARFVYDQAGYLRGAVDHVTGAAHYVHQASDADGQPTLESYGNGVTTTRTYDPQRRWVESIVSAGAPAAQGLTYVWLPNGDLLSRADSAGQSEVFGYDDLRRLTSATVHRGVKNYPKTVAYDVFGNITSKSDVGLYNYDGAGRLTAVNGVTVTHELDGSIDTYGVRSFDYTPFAKVRTATDGVNELSFTYDANGDRVRRRDDMGDTITLGKLYERKVQPNGTSLSSVARIQAGDRIVAQVQRTKWALFAWISAVEFLHDDNLGSTNLITGSSGLAPITVVSSVAYDPWGRARKSDNWSSSVTDATASAMGVGFTGHRAELDAGLIDMSGRMYDPKMARFTSADPLVGDPYKGQSYNRYSYVGNRPLLYTDPTGWSAQGGSGEPWYGDSIGQRLDEFIAMADAQAARWSGSIENTYYDEVASGHLWGLDDLSGEDVARLAFETAISTPRAIAKAGRAELEARIIRAAVILADPAAAGVDLVHGIGLDLWMNAMTVIVAYAKITDQMRNGEYRAAAKTWFGAAKAAYALASYAVGSAVAKTALRGARAGARAVTAPKATAPYQRPSGATTPAQRASVQGKPCVDCGAVTPRQFADHKVPLVVEHYQTGAINTGRMRTLDAVQPHCPSCSYRQGAEMSRYSREQRQLLEND